MCIRDSNSALPLYILSSVKKCFMQKVSYTLFLVSKSDLLTRSPFFSRFKHLKEVFQKGGYEMDKRVRVPEVALKEGAEKRERQMGTVKNRISSESRRARARA